MKERLHKRLVFLTNSLLAIFSVALIFFLHRVDTWSKKDELIAINTIVESNSKLDIDDGFNFNELDGKIRRWLSRTDAQLYRANRSAREQLSYYLNNLGYSVEEIKSAKVSGQDNDKIFLMTGTANLESLLKKENNSDDLLTNDLDLFILKASPNDIVVVSEIDTASIQSEVLDSLRKNSNPSTISYGRRQRPSLDLIGVIVMNDSLKIILSEPESSMQENLLEFHIDIPAKISHIDGRASLFELYGMENEQVKSTFSQGIVEDLRSAYGELPTPDAKDLIGEEYARSYKSIDIFGFSFPTQNFAYALIFFMLLIAVGLNHTLNICLKNKIKLFSKIDGDELIEPFLDGKGTRFCLWVLLPLVAVAFAIPSIRFGSVRFTIVIAVSIALIGLFYLVYRKSIERNA